MNKKNKIKTCLQKKILLLDGASGTELQLRGMPAGVCPEVWCLEHPQTIQEVHRSYKEAGSDMVYTCTFGANRLKLAEFGAENVKEVNAALARLARQAVGKDVLIAGDMGPTGRFVEPFGDLPFEEAVAAFREQAEGLIAGGVDCFVIETMIDIQEARAALLAVKELGDYFTIVTMTYEQDGRTLNGTDPVTALITLQSLGADAVGCNCSAGPDGMMDWIGAMKPYATVPLVAKPNAGLPKLKGKKTVFDMDAASFGAFGKPFAEIGLGLLGGCCGTTPAHIRALAENIQDAIPIAPWKKSLSAVSSVRGFKLFDPQDPLVIIGERINPTGKKDLQQELSEGKTAIVRQMAKDQQEQGADLLDVNVGVPGIDEPRAIRDVIRILVGTTPLPLTLDSPKIETLEAALRLYPGRALINSISGESEKLKTLLPLAAKYGAMFILLPLEDGHIPETAAGRQAVIRKVFQAAKPYGYTKEDIVVDGLVMTVASNPAAAGETIKTVAWCAETFKCRTVLGISNVSFGLPERKWINAAFLTMAQGAGLTMAIANPATMELLNAKRAADVLLEKDKGAAHYIAAFASATKTKNVGETLKRTAEEKVGDAVLEGNREEIVPLIERLLQQKRNPAEIIDRLMIPAILTVGERYDRREYFLPQLIASAEAMKKGLTHLEPALKKTQGRLPQKGIVLLATVQGDIHDIGKNIVALMLKNHGYQVIDLGKDVATETIIQVMKKSKPQVVGLSALMTTTMVAMKDVIRTAGQAGLAAQFLLGGAVVTEAYAASLGAAYAKDGVEAVRVVDRLINKQ